MSSSRYGGGEDRDRRGYAPPPRRDDRYRDDGAGRRPRYDDDRPYARTGRNDGQRGGNVPPPRRSVSPSARRREPDHARYDYERRAPPPGRYAADDRRGGSRDYRDDYRRDTGPPPPREERYERPSARERRNEDEVHAGSSTADGTRPDPREQKAKDRDAADEGEAAEEEGGEDDDDMMKAMGFGGFGSTKGSKVAGNQAGMAQVKKERTWRQYMQRKGGFNRPLSPVRK